MVQFYVNILHLVILESAIVLALDKKPFECHAEDDSSMEDNRDTEILHPPTTGTYDLELTVCQPWKDDPERLKKFTTLVDLEFLEKETVNGTHRCRSFLHNLDKISDAPKASKNENIGNGKVRCFLDRRFFNKEDSFDIRSKFISTPQKGITNLKVYF